MSDVSLRYLSLGAGVQSTTLALMIAHGELPPIDCAIFADTHWEPRAVYAHLEWLCAEIARLPHPFPVHRVSAGSLRQHVLDGVRRVEVAADGEGVYRGIPAYVKPGGTDKETGQVKPVGMLRRQCTREYKIAPITAKVRELLGLEPGQRVPRDVRVEQLTGISSDEADRAKPAPEKWLVRLYPLLDARITRMRCIAWMREHGYPDPPRSACLGCPLHSIGEWKRLRKDDPAGFADAVAVDEAIRGGLVGGINAREVYLHARAKPLVDAVDDDAGQLDLGGGGERGGWGNECEGACGV